MPVEVRGGEEGGARVLHQGFLVRLGLDPEDDHVRVSLSGLRVDRIGPRVAKEDERLTAYLVHRVLAPAVHDRDMRHAYGELVNILDTSLSPGWHLADDTAAGFDRSVLSQVVGVVRGWRRVGLTEIGGTSERVEHTLLGHLGKQEGGLREARC